MGADERCGVPSVGTAGVVVRAAGGVAAAAAAGGVAVTGGVAGAAATSLVRTGARAACLESAA